MECLVELCLSGCAVLFNGELLNDIELQPGARTDLGTVQAIDRKQAAVDAGLSLHQMKNGFRAANISEEQFEEMIERDKPATVAKIATAGTQPASSSLPGTVVAQGQGKKRILHNQIKRAAEAAPKCYPTSSVSGF